MPVPNHLMALHLLWDKSKILHMSHKGFHNPASRLFWHHLLLLPSHQNSQHSCILFLPLTGPLHTSSPCPGSFSPILLQFNWKPSATLSLILQARDGLCLICDPKEPSTYIFFEWHLSQHILIACLHSPFPKTERLLRQ